MDAVAPPMMDAAIGEPGVACTGAWDDASRWIEIFGEVAAGRTEPLGDLYDMASRRLYGLALWRTGSRDLAAEVVQELFIRVAEHGERLASIRGPRWWLLSVTHRLAIDAVRRAVRREAEPIEEHAELAADGVDCEPVGDRQQPPAQVPDGGKPLTVLRDTDEQLLHHLGGEVAAAGPPQGEPVQPPARHVVQVPERLGPAGRHLAEDLDPARRVVPGAGTRDARLADRGVHHRGGHSVHARRDAPIPLPCHLTRAGRPLAHTPRQADS